MTTQPRQLNLRFQGEPYLILASGNEVVAVYLCLADRSPERIQWEDLSPHLQLKIELLVDKTFHLC